MKFDEVYEFFKQGPRPTKLTEIELALHYLASFYENWECLEWRCAESPPLGSDIEILDPVLGQSMEFTRNDVLEYLVSEGGKLNPYAGEPLK